ERRLLLRQRHRLPGGRRDLRGVCHTAIGRVFRITPGPRGSARTPPEGAPPAALSSVADAPHRRPPPPCSRTHQAPLTGNRQGAADPVGVIRKTRPLAPVVTVPSVPLQCRDEHDAPTRLVPRPARPAPGTLVGRHRLDRAPARPGGRGGTG